MWSACSSYINCIINHNGNTIKKKIQQVHMDVEWQQHYHRSLVGNVCQEISSTDSSEIGQIHNTLTFTHIWECCHFKCGLTSSHMGAKAITIACFLSLSFCVCDTGLESPGDHYLFFSSHVDRFWTVQSVSTHDLHLLDFQYAFCL